MFYSGHLHEYATIGGGTIDGVTSDGRLISTSPDPTT